MEAEEGRDLNADILPAEMWAHLFSYVAAGTSSAGDLFRCGQVSKAWRERLAQSIDSIGFFRWKLVVADPHVRIALARYSFLRVLNLYGCAYLSLIERI